VSDTWPPTGPQKREPLLEHIRDLWVLHGIESNCVAGLYQTTFGIELRIHQNNELIESRLSRYGEEPLLLIAKQAKQNLLKLRLDRTAAERDAGIARHPLIQHELGITGRGMSLRGSSGCNSGRRGAR